jgi:hypothetical protein
MSAQSSPFASALGLMQSSDQLRSGYGDVDISRFFSTRLPASYLPLGSFDEVIYLGCTEIQKALQSIIYRLCWLALTRRSDVIAGQPRPVIANLYQLLWLGFEDMNLGKEDHDVMKRGLIYSAMSREDGTSLMEQHLWKIYEMLRTAHELAVIKKPGEWGGILNHIAFISILTQF